MKYIVKEDQIFFEDRKSNDNRKRGRRPGSRLAAIIKIANLTISDIARIYTANKNNPAINVQKHINCGVVRRELSKVLANKDNSPAYIRALEKAWKLSIEEIRATYQLDKTNPLTSKQEKIQFEQNYLEKYFPEKFQQQQKEYLIYLGQTE